jgi:toxin-antitoxin system, antitoxin component, xre family|nr:MAG TPA: Helix-turn-helix XRE-family like protein [Caudoviricetes sp.]
MFLHDSFESFRKISLNIFYWHHYHLNYIIHKSVKKATSSRKNIALSIDITLKAIYNKGKVVIKMRLTLKAARVNSGLEQKEAAEKLGISRDSLRSYEKYKKSPKIDLAIRIAKLYNCSLSDLIFLQDNIA